MSVLHYQIDVSDARIERLKQKLEHASFPDELDEAGWDYGAPLNDVKRLAEYWRNGFNWKEQEAKLNRMPQFTTKIQVENFNELDIHFVHQRSPVPGAIPLLFCHGWPGSFIEVEKLLPLLQGSSTTPAFSIVAPSLPNFGFSSAVKQKGFALDKYARVCNALMLRLGYHQYVTQGGDWGYYITRCVGKLFPNHCKASHINFVRANPPTYTSNPILALQHAVTPYTDFERRGVDRSKWFLAESSGYRALQSTKPQTPGYALADSPVALLAWIYEKLHDWTDNYPWTDDEILTWISIYWFSTAGPAASFRIYYESDHAGFDPGQMSDWIPDVKLGLAYFPGELRIPPKTWGRTMGPVVHESVNEKGGHFAAHENPQAIANDLNQMFRRGGPCASVVKEVAGRISATL